MRPPVWLHEEHVGARRHTLRCCLVFRRLWLVNPVLRFAFHCTTVGLVLCPKLSEQSPLCIVSVSANMTAFQDPQTILARLRGQKITFQDLNAMFSGWPSKVNPELHRLRVDVDVWLDK